MSAAAADEPVGPYACAAQDYLDTGWSPFPLPPQMKEPPPVGTTGYSGTYVTQTIVDRLLDGHVLKAKLKTGKRLEFLAGDGNIALHLPSTVYGIDVDQYGVKIGEATIEDLEAVLGDLPPTWRSTARGHEDGSGIRLYRVPPGLAWKTGAGMAVDAIHWGHRYMVVEPSVHPGGDVYRWYDPDGMPSPIPLEEWLPELPKAWVDYLSKGEHTAGQQASSVTSSAVREWYAGLREGGPCAAVRYFLGQAAERLEEAKSGSRHDVGMALLLRLLYLGEAGHSGIEAAIDDLKEMWVDALADGESRDPGDGEWKRGLVGGLAKVIGETDPDDRACCDPGDVFTAVEVDEEDDPAAPADDCDDVEDFIGTVAPPTTRRTSAMPKPTQMALPAAKNSLRVAGVLGQTLQEPSDLMEHTPRLLRWRDEWWRWTGSYWENYEPAALRAWVYRMLGSAVDSNGNSWGTSASGVSNVLDAMMSALFISRNVEMPGWLRRSEERIGVWTGCQNGILNLDDRTLIEADPAYFNAFAVDCDWDTSAPEPTRWLEFLGEVLIDEDQIRLLQEWFGYVLSGRIDLEKAIMILGPPRSGKGTIVHVLSALISERSVAKPTFGSFDGPFGTQVLIGKRLAVVGDARTGAKANHGPLEKLLNIVGRDKPAVARKNMVDFEGDLQCLFMILSNNIPSFDDPSGAMMTRLEFLETRQSFAGREITTLKDTLLEELPGIMGWALDGYDRIKVEGAKLTVPESTAALKQEAAAQMSRLSDLVDTKFILGGDRWASTADLYRAYEDWFKDSGGAGFKQNRTSFIRDLMATCSGLGRPLKRSRPGSKGKQEWGYQGISLVPIFTDEE